MPPPKDGTRDYESRRTSSSLVGGTTPLQKDLTRLSEGRRDGSIPSSGTNAWVAQWKRQWFKEPSSASSNLAPGTMGV